MKLIVDYFYLMRDIILLIQKGEKKMKKLYLSILMLVSMFLLVGCDSKRNRSYLSRSQ